jgi:hypothetical protein
MTQHKVTPLRVRVHKPKPAQVRVTNISTVSLTLQGVGVNTSVEGHPAVGHILAAGASVVLDASDGARFNGGTGVLKIEELP